MRNRFLFLFPVILLSGFLLTACDSPEEKEAKYIHRGDVLFERGDYDKARVEYKNAVRINPTSADVQYKIGLVDEAQSDIRSAFKAFIAAEQQNPKHQGALLKLAQYYLVAEQYEQTINRLDKVLADAPDQAQAHALRAALSLRQKDFAASAREAQKALDKEPGNVTAFTVLVGIELEKKDMAKAATVVEQAISRNPKDLSLLLLKAMVYDNSGNLDKVAEAYQAVFKIKPKALRFRFDLADLYFKAGRKDEAGRLLRQTVSDLPDSKEAKQKLFAFIAEAQGLEAAEKEIHATADKDEAVLWLADLYIRLKDTDRAIALLEKMVAENQDFPDGSFANPRASLARLQFAKGNKEIAQKLVDAVLEKDVNNADALFIRASLAFDQGRHQDAIADLRTVTRDNPKNGAALHLLAEALLAQGHLDLAVDTLNQLVVVDPSNENAQVRLAQLLSLKGEKKKARELLAIVNKNHPELAVGWESTARIAIEEKEWPVAQEAVEKLQGLGSHKETATFLSAQIDMGNGREAQGLAKLKDVVLANPEASLAEYALASMLLSTKSEESLRDVAKFIEGLQNPSARTATVLGDIYLRLGKKAEAIAQLDKVISSAPSFQEPYLLRAKLFSLAKQNEEALAVLKKAWQVAPSDIRAPMASADMLGAMERYSDAIALYSEILALRPEAAVAANNMAQLIADYQSDDAVAMEKARVIAERFVSSSNPLFLDTLAWVYFRQGKVDQARAIMDRVMAFGGTLPVQVLYHHGAILAKQGRNEEAKVILQKAVDVKVPYTGIEEARKILEGL